MNTGGCSDTHTDRRFCSIEVEYSVENMPASHTIDTERNLITTVWSGEANDAEMCDSLTKYQQDIRSDPEYCSYNEIVDFSKASGFKITTEGLRKLVQIASAGDNQEFRTKMAIIVSAPVAYGLARMYEVYRSLIPKVSKEIRIFRQYESALDWLDGRIHADSD